MREIRLIVTGILALLAIGWFWFRNFRIRAESVDAGRLFTAVFGVGLFCRLAFVFFTPPFYAPDEQSHFNYIKYFAERHTLPVQTHKMGDPANDWEYSQPPFYYVLLTPVFMLAKTLFHHPAAILFALRLSSVLLWVVNVRLGSVLLKRLDIKDPLIRNFVMAMVCLLPAYTFISAMVNNDNLLAVMGSGLLCLMADRGRSLWSSLVFGGLLGLALLTKQSALVFIPAILLLWLIEAFASRRRWGSTLAHLFVVLAPAFLLSAPWVLRNRRIYGAWTPETLSVVTVTWPYKPYGLASALHNMIKTFWAASGISNDISYPFPLAGWLFLWLCLIWRQNLDRANVPERSLTDASSPRVHSPTNSSTLRRPFFAACMLALAINIGLVLRLGYLFGMGQGRHLFALLYPIALFLAARWRTFPVRSLEPYTTGIWILYSLGFLLFGLWRFP